MDQVLTPVFRLAEASRLVGFSVPTLRRKIARGEVGILRTGKIITIPESEIFKLRGIYYPPK